MSVGSPTAGTWSSSQWRPDNEFETDRRGWRKLHLGVDQSGVICVHTMTEATGEDATTALDLLNAVEGPLVRVTADAAYDTVAVYETAGARGATVVVPPARTANVSGHGPRPRALLARFGRTAAVHVVEHVVIGQPVTTRVTVRSSRSYYTSRVRFLSSVLNLISRFKLIHLIPFSSLCRATTSHGRIWLSVPTAAASLRCPASDSSTYAVSPFASFASASAGRRSVGSPVSG